MRLTGRESGERKTIFRRREVGGFWCALRDGPTPLLADWGLEPGGRGDDRRSPAGLWHRRSAFPPQ